MNPSDNALQQFAERMRCAGAPAHHIRERLEASLVPLVRRALRSGAGIPQLVQWVQKTLPQVQAGEDRTRPADPDRAAPPLARLLCSTLLQPRLAPAAAGETILGL